MRLIRPLTAAAFLGAAMMVSQSFAQAPVPSPPPAGVLPKKPRIVPMEQVPSEVPQTVPMTENQPLPQLPENPIKLEQNLMPPASPAPAAAPVTEPMPAPTAPVSKRPVKPVGPVYYYAPGGFPANVTTPPAMHVPNSPWVEDLSVAGDHGRYVYYSYRRPWYTPGQLSANVTIVW